LEKATNQNRKRVLVVAVIIVLIAILFALLVDIQAVTWQLKAADIRFLIAASIMLLCGLAAYAIRWRALLGNKPGLLFTFHASNMGHAANILIPLRAGEAVRILVMGTEKTVSFTEATTSVVVERLFEQLMRLLTIGAAILVGVGLQLSPSAVIGGIGFLALGFGAIAWLVGNQSFTLAKGSRLLAKLPRVTEEKARIAIADLLENLEGVSKPRHFALILFWSLITWAFFWAFFYLTLLSLGDVFPTQQRVAISLGAMALSPPSAPTQPGIFHASIVVPLAAIGIDAETLTAYAVLLHILEMFWMIGLAIWGLIATGSSLRSLQGLFKSGS
jgi:uncharacterized protein (TIRG00374 family)